MASCTPTTTGKQNLGWLYGGQIASINYNFQHSSEPSTATLTILSEGQVYQKPQLGSTVRIPPFGISMDVVEWSMNKGPKQQFIQVEFVESLHTKLDKELVLIYGVHTTPWSETSKSSYRVFKSMYIDERYWETIPHERFKFPTYPSGREKYSDGINVIGLARATLTRDNTTAVTKDFDFKPEAEWLKFDNGLLRDDLSNGDLQDFTLKKNDDAGQLGIAYGFTLKQLSALMKNKGIRFAPGSWELMQDENVLFEESGTIREVLTSSLAKIGRGFYVHPITQQIKIITNADLLRINNHLYSKYSSFNQAGATQCKFTESLKGVSANHLVLKGSLNERDQEAASDNGSIDPVSRTDKLYRVEVNVIADLTKKEKLFIYKTLPLVGMNVDDHYIESYIFGLASKYQGNTDWGDLYGKKQFEMSKVEYLRSKKDELTLPAQKFWKNFDQSQDPYPFLKKDTVVTAKKFFRRKSKDDGTEAIIDPLMPREEYIPFMKSFIKMWAGIYISDAMTEKEASLRQYSKYSKREGNTESENIKLITCKGNDFISQYGDLDFLVKLLKKEENEVAVTINDLAAKSDANNSITGDEYYVIAFRIPFFDERNLQGDVTKFIGNNMEHSVVPDASGSGFHWVGTKDSNDAIKSIEAGCERMVKAEEENRYRYLLVPFVKTKDSPGGGGGGGESPMLDRGNTYFLGGIRSTTRLFERRTLSMINVGVSEAELLLDNFNDINPAIPSPLISTTITYDRPPILSDFNPEHGVSSLAVSISDAGAQTTITYSSRKYARLDLSIARDFLSTSFNKSPMSSFLKTFDVPAWKRNRTGE